MDILSADNLRALRLCGDDDVISDDAFNALIPDACSVILGGEADHPGGKICASVDQRALMEVFTGVMCLLLEAGKLDIDEDQLNLLLDDCNFSSSKKESFVSVFNENRSKIREHLGNIGIQLPTLVDVKWRLDYNLKNSSLHKVNELKYTISLKENSSNEPVEFHCSKEELQDLVSKLREACKALERASQV
nr:COMM domain-containing protein 3 [Ciona intestinalis]|eukprot:XP_002125922.1 COMM domain-containing protein 3 [Ciona intestinalis]